MMLTFLGDPRARDAVLGAARSAARRRSAVPQSADRKRRRPVKVCKLQVEPARQAGSACLFNAATSPRKTWACACARSPPRSPTATRSASLPRSAPKSSYHVPGELPPNEGRVASFGFDLRGERVEDLRSLCGSSTCCLSDGWRWRSRD